jgi:uncharacterized membrane protein
MIDSKKAIGVAMALAAAGMISTSAPVFAGSADAKVHCFGVNKCAGHNDCKTATNACKGQASCKGLGFVAISAAACDHLGGTVK